MPVSTSRKPSSSPRPAYPAPSPSYHQHGRSRGTGHPARRQCRGFADLRASWMASPDEAERRQARGGDPPARRKRFKERAKEAGGLLRDGHRAPHEKSRRIDNQLRGRSGRQGDPGRSKFYLSLQGRSDADLRIRPDGEHADQASALRKDESIHPSLDQQGADRESAIEGRNAPNF